LNRVSALRYQGYVRITVDEEHHVSVPHLPLCKVSRSLHPSNILYRNPVIGLIQAGGLIFSLLLTPSLCFAFPFSHAYGMQDPMPHAQIHAYNHRERGRTPTPIFAPHGPFTTSISASFQFNWRRRNIPMPWCPHRAPYLLSSPSYAFDNPYRVRFCKRFIPPYHYSFLPIFLSLRLSFSSGSFSSSTVLIAILLLFPPISLDRPPSNRISLSQIVAA